MTAQASASAFNPAADAYVSSILPFSNYGAASGLRTDASPVRRSYLRFDLTGLEGTVQRATLRVYAATSDSRGYRVAPVAAAWLEAAITYANAPTPGAAVGSSGPVTKGTWTEVDVTPLVAGNGPVSLALISTSSTATSYASREAGTTAPRLEVETAVADTTPPTVSISDPLPNTTYTEGQTVPIEAAATDASGVARVEFYDNGVLRGTEDTAPFAYSWAFTAIDNGSHIWMAKAVDGTGNAAASAPVTLVVDIATPEPGTLPPPITVGPVTAGAETTPVPDSGDAADDAAIWVHPGDPALSTVIGGNKLGGLAVYDLSGAQLHYYGGSTPNNVDLRPFTLGGTTVSLVVTSNHSDDTIGLYRVDLATRGLVEVGARTVSVGIGLYGLCMYRSPVDGATYVFDSDSSGTLQQWELFEAPGAKVDAKKVRQFTVGSTTEGCVADDAAGALYVAEEDRGIWRYGAEPGAGTTRSLVDTVGGGHLTADVEGLALYDAGAGAGYLLASSQGDNTFAVYDRQTHAYVMSFSVQAGALDAVTYTDGIDVSSAALGPAFGEGLFVAQDDGNDGANQNFKLVSWGAIARSVDFPLVIAASRGGWTPPPPAPAPTPATTGTTYYLDGTGGDDANPGTSPTAAWRTLSKASAAPLAPGDALLLARGRRWTGTLTVSASGTAQAPVTVGAYGSGVLPLVKGASSCVQVQANHVVVRELHADACSWAGIAVSGSHNLVEANTVTHNAAGIYVKSGTVGNRIVRNQLRDNNRMRVLTETTVDASDDSGAFGILLRGDDTEVAYNTISGSDAFSYDYGRDGAAVEIYGGQRNHVHHNVAVDNDVFSELGHSRSVDNTFAYNLVRSSLDTSVFLVTRGAKSSYGPILATRLYHNTVVLTGASSQGFVCHAGCDATMLTMRGNIIQAVAKVGYADGPIDEDHDLFYGGWAQFTQGASSVVADPRFVDPAAGDFRLQPSSPAIDSAPGAGYAVDLNGVTVPLDGNGDAAAAPDRGAFELAFPVPA